MIRFYATIPAGDERPFMPQTAYLLPASSWALDRFKMRAPRLPSHITETAGDCGGYVAMTRWGGEYQYTPEQYVNWLRTFCPQWAATMDFCCEPAIAADTEAIRERQDRTSEMARLFFDTYRNEPFAWVPTVQGWHVNDYRRHATELLPLIHEMQAHYGPGAWRLAIGTLCQRADARMIQRVVGAVVGVVGEEIPLHLWGVKQAALSGEDALPGNVVSVDSAAWNGFFGTGHERWKASGMSKREYQYRVALPDYLDRFEDMVNRRSKQTTAWEMFN